MQKYTDDEIRNMKKITCRIAADYLGIAPICVSMGMREGKLPIGVARFKSKNQWGCEYWSYYIVPERLIAYKNGTLNETDIQKVEEKLDRIADEFAGLKEELMAALNNRSKRSK